MLINWFTVGAQAVNFIVLVWLLKRFLYQPVLRGIDAREQRIAGELAAADRQKAEATASHDDLQAKSKAFDDERAALLAKATVDAKSQGERLLAEARTAAEALVAQRRAAVEGETAKLSRELTRLAAAESISIARAALQTLAGSDLDARISEVFVKRVRALDSKAKESFGAALKGSNAGCAVVSSFPIEERERAAIQTALNETFSADLHLRFETSSRVIGGIELEAGGQRLSWSVADYLKTLDEKVGALLRTGDTAARATAPAAADHAAAGPRPAVAAATPAPAPAAAVTSAAAPVPAPAATPAATGTATPTAAPTPAAPIPAAASAPAAPIPVAASTPAAAPSQAAAATPATTPAPTVAPVPAPAPAAPDHDRVAPAAAA